MRPVRCGQFLVVVAALLLFSVTAIAQQSAKPNFPADIDLLHEKAAGNTDPNAAAPQQAASSKSRSEGEVVYQQAAAMEQSGKVSDAVRIYRRAARAGSEKAARRLGEIFDKGAPGVSRDYSEALSWYKKAQELAPGGASTTPGGTPLIGDFGRPGRR